MVIFATIICWIWRVFVPAKGRPMVCVTCGHHGPTKSHTKGSMLLEIVLWLLLIVPGLIYSIWRVSSRSKVCAACGGPTLVPADTPAGRKLLKDAAE
jgi:hypothetical protein